MPDSIQTPEARTSVSAVPVQNGSTASPVLTTVCLVSPFNQDSEASPAAEGDAQQQTTEVIDIRDPTSTQNRQERQTRVYTMMKDLQQKHLANIMQTEINSRENADLSNENQGICRICHSVGEEPLVTPCRCSGSAKYVHATCLLTWFKKAVKNTCELCRCKVAIKKKGRPFAEWKRPEDKPIPLIWFVVFLVGLFLNVFSIAVNASELCDTTACIIFYVVNGFGVVLDAAFLYFWWTKCLFYWRKWRALNQDWSINMGTAVYRIHRQNQDERSSIRTLQISQLV